MDDQLQKKIQRKVEPINKWIDAVATKAGPKAGRQLAALVSCEIGKKMIEFEKQEQLQEIDNLN